MKCVNGRLFNSWILRNIIKMRVENHALIFVLFPISCDFRSPMPRTMCSAETSGCLGLQKWAAEMGVLLRAYGLLGLGWAVYRLRNRKLK